MDIILFYGMGIKVSELQYELYFKDTAEMDAVPPRNNSGLMSRAAFFGTGAVVQMTGPLKLICLNSPVYCLTEFLSLLKCFLPTVTLLP